MDEEENGIQVWEVEKKEEGRGKMIERQGKERKELKG